MSVGHEGVVRMLSVGMQNLRRLSRFCDGVNVMTLQVAISCVDGKLLASDSKVTLTGQYQYTTSGPKIFKAKDRSLAVACAGYDLALTAARMLVKAVDEKKFDFSNVAQELERVGEEAYKEEFSTILSKLEDRGRSEQPQNDLLIIGASLKTLFRLAVCSKPRATEFHTRAIAGDIGNSSIFILERYLPNKRVTLSQAKLAAAHFILMGGEVNQTSVGGLEMVTLSADGFIQDISAN